MGLKVFSATKRDEREVLGEAITAWIAEHPELEIASRECRLSSDDEFHCLTITLFYRPRSKRAETNGAARAGDVPDSRR